MAAGAAQVGAVRRTRRRCHSRHARSPARARERSGGLGAVVRRRAATPCGTLRLMRPDERRTVYDGKLIDVTLERWGDQQREIVEHPGAVAVVAVDGDGMVTLVRQRREAVRKDLLELPAGTLEDGEAPQDSARRELEEETGLRGGAWREVVAFYTTPGFCRERMHLFFAEGLERGEASPAEDEQLEIVRLPVREIASHLAELEDAKTLVGLLLYLRKTAADAA